MSDMRIDYHPTQPKDCGELSDREYDERWNEAIERRQEDLWIALYEELNVEQRTEILVAALSEGRNNVSDFTETGRLISKYLRPFAKKIIENEIHEGEW